MKDSAPPRRPVCVDAAQPRAPSCRPCAESSSVRSLRSPRAQGRPRKRPPHPPRPLPPPEAARWRDALAFYDAQFNPHNLFDRFVNVMPVLFAVGPSQAPSTTTELDEEWRSRLLLAAPIYRTHFWPAHEQRDQATHARRAGGGRSVRRRSPGGRCVHGHGDGHATGVAGRSTGVGCRPAFHVFARDGGRGCCIARCAARRNWIRRGDCSPSSSRSSARAGHERAQRAVVDEPSGRVGHFTVPCRFTAMSL